MPPKRLRILLVEDDPDDAELVQSLLNEIRGGVELVHAGMLALGIRQLESQEFDLVLLDMSLPDSWGTETLRRVRKRFPKLPVVLMTGAAMGEIAEEAEREGALACLFKQDLDPGKLAQVLSCLEVSGEHRGG